MKNTYKLELVWYCKNGGSGSEYAGRLDVSDSNTANWRDITLAFKRTDLCGIVRSFSTSFSFVRDAREVVVNCFNYWGGFNMDGEAGFVGRQDGDYCRVELRLLQEDWTWPSAADFVCDLDFTTLKLTRGQVSVQAVENTLTAKIKDAGGTKYSLSAQDDDIADFCYLGLRRKQRIYLKCTSITTSYLCFQGDGDNREDGKFVGGRGFDGNYMGTAIRTDSPRKVPFQIWYQVFNSVGTTDTRTLTARADWTPVTIRIVFTCSYIGGYHHFIFKLTRGGTTYQETIGGTVVDTSSTRNYVSYDFTWTDEIQSGDEIQIVSANTGVAHTLENDYNGREYDNEIYIDYLTEGRDTVYLLPAFTPSGLADILGEKITGRSMRATGESAIRIAAGLPDVALFSTGLLNSTENGVLETTYNDFAEWLRVVFDYVPTLQTAGGVDYVEFRPRTAVISPTATVSALSEGETAEVAASVKTDLLFRRVVAGYNKHEYEDGEIGENEFCVPVTYEPADAASTEKEMKLLSPYRADTAGMEQAIAEYDPDKPESGDVWFVHTQQATYTPVLTDGEYDTPLPAGTWTVPVQGGVSGGAQGGLWLNARFSPRNILAAHDFHLFAGAGGTGIIKYVSQDGGKKTLVVDGVSMDADYQLDMEDAPLYPTPTQLQFITSELSRAIVGGRISVVAYGYRFTGWVTDVKFHILHAEKAQYTLQIQQIERL